MGRSKAKAPTLPSMEAMIEALGGSLEPWACQCHSASCQLVNADIWGSALVRVARGTAKGVFGQHSWVVVGRDCYDPKATVVDPTLWSYDKSVEGIWIGKAKAREHRPHGYGSIWNWGKPAHMGGETVLLTPVDELSWEASRFLGKLGPLDLRGWITLAHAPVEGWPSDEIINAMCETKGLRGFIPIDRVGMLTARNPGGLYLPEGKEHLYANPTITHEVEE